MVSSRISQERQINAINHRCGMSVRSVLQGIEGDDWKVRLRDILADHPGCHMRSVLLLSCLANVACAADPVIDFVVSAGAHDRRGTTIVFPLPSGNTSGMWRLTGEGGFSSDVAIDNQGEAHAAIPEMIAGERRHFHLVADQSHLPPSLVAHETGDVLRLDMSGQELCTYQGGAGDLPAGYDAALRRGGYLSRLLTPSGVLVTDDYPPNHRHHHGVWFSWTKTIFSGRTPDFWNMGERTGTVEAISRGPVWSGGQWAGFHAAHRYRDLGVAPATTVLNESWDVTIEAPHGDHPVVVVDLVIRQQCASDLALVLPTYRYGGLGVRGNRAWDGAENMTVLTSEGKARVDANETRCRWCWIGGRVDGHLAGVAILCHPGNFRAPQPVRVHPSEPFLCFAPSQMGEWSITPGAGLVLRYRLIVCDGAADAADINRHWTDWADPPTVEFEH
jgi:hypothetical protein